MTKEEGIIFLISSTKKIKIKNEANVDFFSVKQILILKKKSEKIVAR